MQCSAIVSRMIILLLTGLIGGCPQSLPEKKGQFKEVTSHKKEQENPYAIYQFSDPRHYDLLYLAAKPVRYLPSREVDDFIPIMLEAMRINQGVGISANQLGQPWQMFIIGPLGINKSVKSSISYKVYINPVIEKASKEKVCFWHGCLSAKGEKMGEVATWKTITISAVDNKGHRFTEDLTGIEAIIAQHEFRHLLGGSYLDYSNHFENEKTLMMKVMKGQAKMFRLCDDSQPFLLNDYKLGQTIEEYAYSVGKMYPVDDVFSRFYNFIKQWFLSFVDRINV